MNERLRTALLLVDGLALVGLIVFTVLSALHRDETAYLVGQIVSAVVVLATVIALRRLRVRP